MINKSESEFSISNIFCAESKKKNPTISNNQIKFIHHFIFLLGE